MQDLPPGRGRARTLTRSAWRLRGPILVGLALLLYPAVALTENWGRPIRGHFDLAPGRAFLAGLAAGLAAFAIVATGRVLLLYGTARVQGGDAGRAESVEHSTRGFTLLLALPVMAVTTYVSARFADQRWIAVLVAGALGVWAAFEGARLTWLTVERALDRVAPGTTTRWQRLMRWAARHETLSAGYLVVDLGRVRLLRGHRLLMVLFVAGAGVYLAFGVAGAASPERSLVPTLAYFMVMVQFLALVTGAAAFFLERFRAPAVISVTLALLLAAWLLPDHVVRVVPRASTVPRATMTQSPQAVVVAAGGGGLLSTAWTVRVLTGLEERCRTSCEPGSAAFAGSIAAISSVSGGAVGTMFFVEALEDGLDDAAIARANERAQKSYQDAIAFGLLYEDPFRWLPPPTRRYGGRGRTLERAWTADGSRGARPLSAWSHAASRGTVPALVFNATTVDSGERFLLATTRLASGDGWKVLHDLDPGADVPIVTAVRLAASASPVTPAARLDTDSLRHHRVADGGYVDNEAVLSAVMWLDDALARRPAGLARVLILRISLGRGSGTVRSADGASPEREHWEARNDEAIARVTRAWQTQGVDIETVEVSLDVDGPLAWHLTARDRRNVEAQWQRVADGPAWHAVRRFRTQPLGVVVLRHIHVPS
jgi:hypothetical protein